MHTAFLLKAAAHGAWPGASDELLGLAFLLLAGLAGWYILKRR